MDARLIDRIETGIERAACALLGGAVGFAVTAGLSSEVLPPELAAYAGGAAAIAYFLSSRTLSAFARSKPQFALQVFDIRELDNFESDELPLTEVANSERGELLLTEVVGVRRDELLLTDVVQLRNDELLLTAADRLDANPQAAGNEPLVLDDILAEIGPESRVVRLFDRGQMPTPGQLKSRVDNHLDQNQPPAPASDASQALSDALAELRRSLR